MKLYYGDYDMPEVNPMNDAFEKISEIQLAVQRIEELMPTFQAELKMALTKELENAGMLVQSGLEKNGEIQFWDLVSSVANNALGLLILASLTYLVCKEYSKTHRKPPKTLIFTKPNNEVNGFDGHDIEAQQIATSLRMEQI